MRSGKSATRPSASRDELKARMEFFAEVGMLMTWPNGLPRVQAPIRSIWSNLVKLGQTDLQPGLSWQGSHCPCHILWGACRDAQRMVVGLCGDRKAGRQFAIATSWPVKPGHTQSNLVKAKEKV